MGYRVKVVSNLLCPLTLSIAFLEWLSCALYSQRFLLENVKKLGGACILTSCGWNKKKQGIIFYYTLKFGFGTALPELDL